MSGDADPVDPVTPGPEHPVPGGGTRGRSPVGHRRIRALAVTAVIGVAVVVLVVGLGAGPGSHGRGPVVPVGAPAPDFSLAPLVGTGPVHLAALGRDAHHPVVLNFFASWCTPCRQETPLMAATARAEQARGGSVRFVGVDANDAPTDALRFAERTGITYPVGLDPTFRVTSGRYGLDGLPQTFFIGADGRVLGHTVGAVDATGLRAWVLRLDGGAG